MSPTAREMEDALVQMVETEFVVSKMRCSLIGRGESFLMSVGEKWCAQSLLSRFPELEGRDIERIAHNVLVRLVRQERLFPSGINGWHYEPEAACITSWRRNCLARVERPERF